MQFFQVVNESNVLVDGTLIDLCGAILLWRSREGIARMPVCILLHFLIELYNPLRGQWGECNPAYYQPS